MKSYFKISAKVREFLEVNGWFDGTIYFYSKDGKYVKKYSKWSNGMVKELVGIREVKW